MRLNEPGESLVVVPSMSPPPARHGAVVQAIEERMLFLLLLLRQPRLQLIYVTGRPVDEAVLEYYLALLPGVIPSHARARLHMVSADDGSPRPLTTKLLERPRILEAIRTRIPDRALCHLVPYTTTTHERDLALALGIPLYGADPRHLPFGTKTGCRRLFEETGVAHPLGWEGILGRRGGGGAGSHAGGQARMTAAIVKHNDGVAGRGNAVVDLRALPAPGSDDERGDPAPRRADGVREPGHRACRYLQRLAEGGGIVEEQISGLELRSPSVQLRITPTGGSSCSPRTISFSAARAARSTSAAGSRPTRLRARDHG